MSDNVVNICAQCSMDLWLTLCPYSKSMGKCPVFFLIRGENTHARTQEVHASLNHDLIPRSEQRQKGWSNRKHFWVLTWWSSLSVWWLHVWINLCTTNTDTGIYVTLIIDAFLVWHDRNLYVCFFSDKRYIRENFEKLHCRWRCHSCLKATEVRERSKWKFVCFVFNFWSNGGQALYI